MIKRDNNEKTKFVDIDLSGYKELPIGEKFIPDEYRKRVAIVSLVVLALLFIYGGFAYYRNDRNDEISLEDHNEKDLVEVDKEVLDNEFTDVSEQESLPTFRPDKIWLRREIEKDDFALYLDSLNRFQESSYKQVDEKNISGTLVSFQLDQNFVQFIAFEMLDYCLDNQFGDSECMDIYFIDSQPEDKINFYFVGKQFNLTESCASVEDKTDCTEKRLPLFIKEQLGKRAIRFSEKNESWITPEMSAEAPLLHESIVDGEFITHDTTLKLLTVEATNELLGTVWGEITLLVTEDGKIIKVVNVQSKL